MRDFEKQRRDIMSLLKVWRFEILLVFVVILFLANANGWARARAYETNYRMCQSNVEEIKELYNNKNN